MIAQLRTDPGGESRRERLTRASDVARDAALERVRGTFPTLDIAGLVDSSGGAVAQLVDLPTSCVENLGAVARLDRLTAYGDLNDGRLTTAPAAPIADLILGGRNDPAARVGLPHRLADLLTAGHTLVLNQVDVSLGGPVAELCLDLSAAYRTAVGVNAYVTQGEGAGLGHHWDDHDVIVMQVAGRRYWELSEPVDLGAIRGFTPDHTATKVVWSGVLEPGQALNIPRGWPHEATGMAGEMSVHLTVSIPRQLAVDALGRGLRDLRPPWIPAGGTPPPEIGDLIEHGVATWRRSIPVLPRNGPLEVLEARAAGHEGWEVRVVLPGGAVFRDTDGPGVVVGANLLDLTLDDELVEVVATLLEHSWITLDELASAVGGRRAAARSAVDLLGSAGLLHWRRAA